MADAEDRWLEARAAVELFVSAYKGDHSAQNAIIERCANSRILSRCAVANSEYVHLKQYVDDRDGRTVFPYFWARFRDGGRRMHADWIAGDFTLFDGSVIQGNLAKDCLIRLSDVEFREADLLATPGIVQTSAASPTLPVLRAPLNQGKYANKVKVAELKPWIAAYAAAQPTTPPFKVILSAAKRAFSPRPVTERLTQLAIAELNLTLDPGNPSTLRK